MELQSSNFPWYAVRTKSNQEKTAATILESKGYEQYLPTYKVRRQWSDRLMETRLPLFPGYVFCRFDERKRLPIMTTPGVVSIVGFGKDPVPVHDAEIQAIQTTLASGLAADPCPFIREGQRVRITRGPLENVEGILLKKQSSLKFVVSVVLLQRSISVDLDSSWISAS